MYHLESNLHKKETPFPSVPSKPSMTATIFERPLPSQVWTPHADFAYVYHLDPLLHRERIIGMGKDQLLTAADEHANRSVISTHFGRVTPQTLEINGFDMLKATANALRAQPDNTRVQAEYAGLRAAHDRMQTAPEPQIILSPPKEGMSYGLGFVFIPGHLLPDGSVPITQKIIMYQEDPLVGAQTSRHIRKVLRSEFSTKKSAIVEPSSPEEYIRSPIGLTHVLGAAALSDERLVSLFGSNPAEIAQARAFRQTLKADMGTHMQEYSECIVQHNLALREGDVKRAEKMVRRAGKIMDTVFGVALKLSYALKTNDWSDYTLIMNAINKGPMTDAAISAMIAPYAHMVADSQCPPAYIASPSDRTGLGILGLWHKDLLGGKLGAGQSEWVKRDCVTCPCCSMQSTKDKPHLYHAREQKWVCANSACKEHNASVYNTIVNGVPLDHGRQQHLNRPPA